MSSEKCLFHWLLLAMYYCPIQADTANLQETLRCTGKDRNSVPLLTTTLTLTVDIASIFSLGAEYRTFSRMACAFICTDYGRSNCHAITYEETDQSCKLYTWKLLTSVTLTLANPTNKYCWKTKVFDVSASLPSLSQATTTATTTTSTNSATTTATISSTVAKPPGIATCSGASTLTTYTQQTSTSCPAISNCTCDKTLNVLSLQGFSNANDCFANCSRNINCLAFSYAINFCYIATATSELPLVYSSSAFSCYCNKSTTSSSTTSNTVTINGVNYPNLSCYPSKLFSTTSYSTKIPIAGGRQADCRCQGGLYLQNGAFVNQSASTFANCFAACEKVNPPPCKAFAFMEANSTCVIAPTSSNGDSTDRGILQCTT